MDPCPTLTHKPLALWGIRAIFQGLQNLGMDIFGNHDNHSITKVPSDLRIEPESKKNPVLNKF